MRLCDYCQTRIAKYSHKFFYYCENCEFARLNWKQDRLPFSDDVPLDLVSSQRLGDIIKYTRMQDNDFEYRRI